MKDASTQALLEHAYALVRRLEQLVSGEAGVPLHFPEAPDALAYRYRVVKTLLGERGRLEPVRLLSNIALDDLREIDPQKERFVRNIRQFVDGLPANNVLLSGSRGTGKSSLVKASLNAFADKGLRLIEVDKEHLVDLPDLTACVRMRPERFVIYCDDLSFDAGEPGYKALKSVLDGSINAAGDNVLIVATSNRRHLLPEYHKDNLDSTYTDDGEMHPSEAVEEKISLSERFGLWISFYPFSQQEYLGIVAQWLRHFGVPPQQIEAARPHALVWALERGSRSGRVAWQFARDYVGHGGQGVSEPAA
jgi:predicted AAA+ superfamily ATPase